MVESQKQYDVAKEHRISVCRVSQVVTKVRKDRRAVDLLLEKQLEKKRLHKHIE